MTESYAGIVTTNELTPIYGRSPYDLSGKSDSDFGRGFVVYIGGFNLQNGDGGVFNPSVVYQDFASDGPDNQNELEAAVLKLGRTGKLKVATGEKYPKVLSSSMSKIRFGYQPCIITYILDVYGFEFQAADPAGTANSLNQPIVFRKSKVIVDDSGNPAVVQYLGNDQLTFSDLKHHQVGGVSALRYYNNMTGPDGIQISKPSPVQSYCLDIYITTEQGKVVYPLSEADIAAIKSGDFSRIDEFGAALSSKLTMVFDPPHDNGGGGGDPS